MKIIRARHLGMCFGVQDAIDLAHQHPNPGQLTILGELVHNEQVISQLQARGLRIEPDPAKVRTAEVMITAHGASHRALQDLRDRGFRVIEATCPLVTHAHRSLSQLVEQGYYPVVIGKSGHVEVRGLTGDFAESTVILEEKDLETVPARARFGVVAQTTQPIEKVRRLVQRLHERFPDAEVRFIDTVCQPTKQRQSAAVELAQAATVVIVIGGSQSNNTRELVATSRQFCRRVYHVQDATGLRASWFSDDDTVGVTAGTSTPGAVIDEVIAWLEKCRMQNAECKMQHSECSTLNP